METKTITLTRTYRLEDFENLIVSSTVENVPTAIEFVEAVYEIQLYEMEEIWDSYREIHAELVKITTHEQRQKEIRANKVRAYTDLANLTNKYANTTKGE